MAGTAPPRETVSRDAQGSGETGECLRRTRAASAAPALRTEGEVG